ncbi:MAG: AarF/UbiB family protein, partial [Pseudomonadota bacterium]|nr:AarF/UbiB family protein [Pseudomonadota bacterium]
MITPTDLLRLGRIALVLIGEGVDELLLADASRPTVRLFFRLLPWNWVPRRRAPRGVRLRRSLERLGPIFVKFGQILSTRRDLLPPDIADELAALQDRVPPFPGSIAHRLVEVAYEGRLDNWLARFDDDPLASASIAQVHTARLHDGREIVLKVLRPGIERTIRRDLRLLYHLARLLGGLTRDIARLRPREVVAEFEFTLIEELDLVREGANASQLRRNFADSGLLYVPEVYWEFTRPGVLAMERIDGIPVDDIAALQSAGVDLRALAHAGVEIFFTQVFEHNFFHADMHPGNIFVSPQGRYLAVDFGIMGTLDPRDQRYLSQNFVAFFNRDYRAVAEAHVRAGWVPPGTRIDQFESAIRAVCEPIFDKPLSEI